MLVFSGNEPCLEIDKCKSIGPNEGVSFGTHRDRHPDTDWPELRRTRVSYAKELPETPNLRQILLEDLAYTYGNDTLLFSQKLKEFKFSKY